MARILYIFPHPDDESFGPATGIHSQIERGHEVHLLTLNRGGATKIRFDLGVSVKEMGEIRLKELESAVKVLGIHGFECLDLEDGGMRELDPRILEKIVADKIESVRPDIVVTYAVHGISGHHDHLVCHAVVKRAFVELQEKHSWLRRLAFFTIPVHDESPTQGGMANVLRSRAAFIDCKIPILNADRQAMHDGLDCYVTYHRVIEETGIKGFMHDFIHFEIFGEDFKPPITYLTEGL